MTADTPFDDEPGAGEVEDATDDGPDPSAAPTGGSASPIARLFDGSADGPAVDDVQRDYGIPREIAVIVRGTVRAATGDGIPPIAEIAIGGGLFAIKRSDVSTGAGEETADESEDAVRVGDL